MINDKRTLRFYLMADRMMNTGKFIPSLAERIYTMLGGYSIMRFLTHLRKSEYYAGRNRLLYTYHRMRCLALGRKLGFNINARIGYGLTIPHYGTVGAGDPVEMGNYCVLHTSTCITGNKKVIGDGLYLSVGAKITNPVTLGDNITVGANSVVNKDFPQGNVLIAGMPARVIKETEPWYIREGEEYTRRHDECERLRQSMGL